MEQKFRPEDWTYSLANKYKVGQSPCDLGEQHIRTDECVENLASTIGVDTATLRRMNILKDSGDNQGERYEQ